MFTAMRFAPGVGASTMPCRFMRGAMGRATMRCRRMGASCRGITARPASVYHRRAASTIPRVSMAANISSSAAAAEAMLTPAVSIAPVRPWAHPQKDAAIEIAWPIIAAGRAAVGCIAVVAVGTYGRGYADGNLCVDGCHKGQERKHGCCAGEKQGARCELVSPRDHGLDLPHFVTLQSFRFRAKFSLLSAARSQKEGQCGPFFQIACLRNRKGKGGPFRSSTVLLSSNRLRMNGLGLSRQRSRPVPTNDYRPTTGLQL